MEEVNAMKPCLPPPRSPWPALALLLAAACGPGSVPGPAGATITVSVRPATAQLVPSSTLTFAATVVGSTIQAVTWSVREGATGGLIGLDGNYTAPPATGTFHVEAASVADPTVSGVAVVTVTPTPVISVTIGPVNPSVQIGRTVTFTAVVSGTTAGQSTAVTWTVEEAGGGTISASGVYTPPGAVGTYHVIATSVADPGKSDRMPVTVTAPTGGIPAPAPMVASTRFTPATSQVSPAMAISGLGRAVLWWDRSQDTSGWDERTLLGYVCVNRPADYVIEASANGGTSWTAVATITGNTYYTRAHVVDLSGYTSVRMRLTSPAANLGSQYMFVEIQLHDARAGLDDWWVFFGDSVTANVFAGPSGQSGLGTGRFGYNVNQLEASRWPIAHNGGVSQGTLNTFLQTSSGRTLFEWWMDDFPGTFVSIGIGVNDINGYSDHAITPAELDVMQGKMERLIQYGLAAGKSVVLPTVRWTNTSAFTGANIGAWNDRLWNTILPKYPSVIRGPDTYSRSLAQGTAGLQADNTHLNSAGATLTQQDWANWAIASIYQ